MGLFGKMPDARWSFYPSVPFIFFVDEVYSRVQLFIMLSKSCGPIYVDGVCFAICNVLKLELVWCNRFVLYIVSRLLVLDPLHLFNVLMKILVLRMH